MTSSSEGGCRRCRQEPALDLAFSMAFQPIVDLRTGSTFAHEALVRPPDGRGGAGAVLEQVDESNCYRFDQQCRVTAIQLAAGLGLDGLLSINFMPNAVYDPATCIRTTLTAAERYGFPVERIVFEFTENERVMDVDHLRKIVEHYRATGFRTAIDDFGAGYAGLGLLADFRSDFVKLDMGLVRGIDGDPGRRAIVQGMVEVCGALGARVIAEGVETVAEGRTLLELGIELLQGYLLARPAFEALPTVDPDALAALRSAPLDPPRTGTV